MTALLLSLKWMLGMRLRKALFTLPALAEVCRRCCIGFPLQEVTEEKPLKVVEEVLHAKHANLT